MKPLPDCQTCGLCCAAAYESATTWADLNEKDFAAMPAKFRKLVDHKGADWLSWEKGRYMALRTKLNRQGDTVCVALKGALGRKVSCAMYEHRPAVCRNAIKPGDKSCRELRREHKERLDP